MEMANLAQQLNLRRVFDEEEMKVFIANLLLVAFASIITPLVWLGFYSKAFVISHAVLYSSVYYHDSCDLSGFVKLIMVLSMCIVAIFELKSLIASIILITAFGVRYESVRNFQLTFLLRACLDAAISIFVSHEQNLITLGMHTASYIIWTAFFLLCEPRKNGYEDLILIAIIGRQVYALINRLPDDDGTVCVMAILSLAWAKLKSLHIGPNRFRMRMRPSFEEGLRNLNNARIQEMIRHLIWDVDLGDLAASSEEIE